MHVTQNLPVCNVSLEHWLLDLAWGVCMCMYMRKWTSQMSWITKYEASSIIRRLIDFMVSSCCPAHSNFTVGFFLYKPSVAECLALIGILFPVSVMNNIRYQSVCAHEGCCCALGTSTKCLHLLAAEFSGPLHMSMVTLHLMKYGMVPLFSLVRWKM